VAKGGRRPFCADCGGSDAHVVTHGEGNIWLCGGCEVLRNDPDAPLRKHPPGLPSTWPSRSKVKQKETLFNDPGF
jgi:hypothetical protein